MAGVQSGIQQVGASAIKGMPNIGCRLNEWQRPVSEYGSNDAKWMSKLQDSPYVGKIDFGANEWARAREAVDVVLKLMLEEMKACAEPYKGIIIEKYIRQGSSRDGLKVIAPDEFDTIVRFQIEGLQPTAVPLKKKGKIIPLYCEMEIQQTMSKLESKFPKLCQENVFYHKSGNVKLNARKLHQAVFQSIIDKAISRVTETVKSDKEVSFKITRVMNAPSVNIKIHMDKAITQQFMKEGKLKNPKQIVETIDVDIVPALFIRNDLIPDPANKEQKMECPVFAVFKWIDEKSLDETVFPNSETIWRVSTSGYEKHTIDLARRNPKEMYILTALRIVKTYFTNSKAKDHNPPQIVTVLKSYHLKQITFYLLAYLCYINKKVKISGSFDALRYFLQFLAVSLENKCLPHFFHSCDLKRHIYPDYPRQKDALRYNLFRGIPNDSLHQAALTLRSRLSADLDIPLTDNDQQLTKIKTKFEAEIAGEDFF